MARRNIDEYKRVLTILDTETYKEKGLSSLSNIEAIFVAMTDKVRPETIRAHIDKMCALKLLFKRGEVSFEINPEWRTIIEKFSK
jgi:hypothetical protein